MTKYDTLKPGEKEIIARQLGRSPRNLAGIAVHCPAGEPQVIATHPLTLHGVYPEVFPTLYWLSCPRLVKAISRLEGAGLIEEIQERVFHDPELLEQLHEAHRVYAEQRMALVNEKALSELGEYPAQFEVLAHSGVGGIMDEGIKCLHTHFADYLVNRKNPVGRLVAERLGEKVLEQCTECEPEV